MGQGHCQLSKAAHILAYILWVVDIDNFLFFLIWLSIDIYLSSFLTH